MVISQWINARVLGGHEKLVAFMAPTEDRIDAVQRQSLIDYSMPGQAPVRIERDGRLGLRWPNGVEAIGFTAAREGRSRSQNISLSWCTEIVDWDPGAREEAFRNLMLATRVGEERLIWDSTAKGRNEVRSALEALNESDPLRHVIIPGTTFDNPVMSNDYFRKVWRAVSGVRREEELLGRSFREAAGALWAQAYFDRSRVTSAPDIEWVCVAVDPATSDDKSADETGVMVGGRARSDGHAYATHDLSGKHAPEVWGALVLDHADPRIPGPRRGRVVVERKHIGNHASYVVKTHAETRGLRTRVIGRGEPWPPFDSTCIFIREENPQTSKGSRAEGPAAQTEAGRVHLVDPGYPGTPAFADLETECTTYVPGHTKRSPNRLDAFAYLVTELRELRFDSAPDHAQDAAAATRLHAELNKQLQGRAAPGAAAVATLAGGRGVVGGGGRRMGF